MFVPWPNVDLFLTGGLRPPVAQSVLERREGRDQTARCTAGRRGKPPNYASSLK